MASETIKKPSLDDIDQPIVEASYRANTNYCSSSNIYTRKFGKILYINGWFQPSVNPPNLTDVIVSVSETARSNFLIPWFDQTDGTFGALYIETGTRDIRRSYSDFSNRIGHYINLMGNIVVY